ncbi:8-amino-7-oxononanoate synthase [Imbroritus primus]|uniref:8-amino-7-oxononanoate synthase n=1 Tax=Imbroritus primus TaxID=3058603 RepID=UPI003D161506
MNLLVHLDQQLALLDALALRRRRHVATTACTPHQTLAAPGAETVSTPLAFCSNDYLGLAAHPALAAALAEGAARYGAGSGGSHLIGGHSAAHAALEQRLAQWYAPYIPEVATLFFSTGYMANLGVLTALGSSDAVLFTDKLNHASLIDGARLADAQVERYPHGNMDNLAMRLARSTVALKFIVTDSVFSMDGDIAPMQELLALAQQHDAWLVVDDAHGFGVLGRHGRGIAEYADLHSERLIYIGTFGKGAGLSGAFVAAHRTIVEWLLQRARTYIFTTATPPAVAHALLASLDLLEGAEGDARRAALQGHVAWLQETLPAALASLPGCPLRLGASQTAIQPVIVGDNATTLALSARLDAAGLRVPAIRPPTVPAGTARLRVSLSAAHTRADLERLVAALVEHAPQVSAATLPA